MSLKGIELQIAIPKTVDAGKIAEQKQQQARLNQDQANVLTERQVLKDQETVLETKEYERTDGDKKNKEDRQAQGENQRFTEEENKTVHPFKGSFVDYTG